MIQFYVALTVFLVSHIIPAYRPLRARLAAAMGERTFMAVYGSVSLGLMIWLFAAYFNAPYVELWPPQDWTRWIPNLAMPIACQLFVIGLTSPNPYSLSFSRAPFDPDNPGIVGWLRHPALWGLVLWSGTHMAPNGDLAAVLMFGLLTALGLYGFISLDAKRKARMGAEWAEGYALAKAHRAIRLTKLGFVRILGGFLLYGVLILAHESVIGLSPYPL